MLNNAKAINPHSDKAEETADRIGRTILAPEILLIPEIKGLTTDNALNLLRSLYEKTKMPAYELIKRLVKDLGVIDGNFIVWTLSKRENETDYQATEWVISNDPDFDVGIDGRHSYSRRSTSGSLFHLGEYNLDYSLQHDKPIEIKNTYAITQNGDAENWTTAWKINGNGIVLGKKSDNSPLPEAVIFQIHKTSKVAVVESEDYLRLPGYSVILDFTIKTFNRP